jgi:two-component system NtrC family sensor kinase
MTEKMDYTNVKKNILASMILVPLVPFISALGIGYFYFASSIEKSTVATMKRIASDHGTMIESFLNERKADLAFISNTYDYNDLKNPAVLGKVYNELQKKSHVYADLGIFDGKGVHVAYHGPYHLTGIDYHDATWFKEVLKKKYYISDVFQGVRRIPHFIIAVAADSPQGTWVVRATIDSNFFNDFVETVHVGKTGEAYLLNSEGLFQTEKRSGGKLMEKDGDFEVYKNTHDGIKSFIAKDLEGVTYVYATMWLKEGSWLLVVKQEKNDAFHMLRTALFLIMIVMVVGGAGLVILAFYITSRVVRRIEKTDAEKGRLSDQLIRAGRFAELGEMATGFAHEINNPLQIMKSEQSLLTLLIDDLDPRNGTRETEEIFGTLAEVKDSLDQISLQIDRCSRITASILKFGRQEEKETKILDIRGFMNEIVQMVEKKAQVHAIAIVKDMPGKPLMANADPAQLQQVFLNLINNAMDSVTQAHGAHGGQIVVSLKETQDTDGVSHLEISVEDNGTGVPKEHLEKIFAPFFTTKPVGKGTGLGLSVCLGIISDMGGTIKVRNLEKSGARFTIMLPAIDTGAG